MNPGPILIIRNTFPTLLSSLLFSAIYYFENTKILSILAITHKNPKTTLLSSISSSLNLDTLFTLSLHCVIVFTLSSYLLFALLFIYFQLLCHITNTKPCA